MNFLNESKTFDYDGYFKYIDSIKNNLPDDLYAFASDIKFYSPSEAETLHDAWLNLLLIKEAASGERSEIRKIQITLEFLGPFHDRTITLFYDQVVGFDLTTPEEFYGPPYGSIGHGDLLAHEILLDGNVFIHNLFFSRGSSFSIKFKAMKHWQLVNTVP